MNRNYSYCQCKWIKKQPTQN